MNTIESPETPPATDDSKQHGAGGFIEFDLYVGVRHNKKRVEAVVCFSDRVFAPCAVEIKGQEMPKTWCEGYTWDDLNILYEAFHKRDRWSGGIVVDLKSLKHFIEAFGFPPGAKMFMHVWRSRLPNLAPSTNH